MNHSNYLRDASQLAYPPSSSQDLRSWQQDPSYHSNYHNTQPGYLLLPIRFKEQPDHPSSILNYPSLTARYPFHGSYRPFAPVRYTPSAPEYPLDELVYFKEKKPAISTVLNNELPIEMPTVHPVAAFDPRADAETLHRAMKGMRTDENTLITVLCRRSAAQREAIVKAYKSRFGKDLVPRIKSETCGEIERLLVALCKTWPDYMASEVNHAVRGRGTREGTLIEVLVSGSNQQICNIAAAYKNLYGTSMEKDIKGDTSGSLKMLLVSLIQGNRDGNSCMDIIKARKYVQRLYRAGKTKIGIDKSTCISILATSSWSKIRQIVIEFRNKNGDDLEKAISSEFSGYIETGLLAILSCAQSRSSYFAERLNKYIYGIGTKDRSLIRIIVGHCDTDLGNIKRAYAKLYGRSLAADISNNTSGYYKRALLELVG